jgi:hypothetical protein
MSRTLVTAALVAVGALVAAAQTPVQQDKPLVGVPPQRRDNAPATPRGSATIAGTVVAADTGRPVRRAHVTLSSTAPDVTLSVSTTDDGHFAFNDLPAGAFTLTASRLGFIDSVLGQKQPGSGRPGTPIQLIDGQHADRVSMAIARGGVLTGTVVDDTGQPEFGAQVRVYRWTMRSGERSLASAGSTTTDDRGQYRATGLLQGDYIVSATSGEVVASDQAVALAKRMAEVSAVADASGDAFREMKLTMASMGDASDPSKDQPTGYAPVYFPGTTAASAAQSVTLGVSEVRQAVDIGLQLVPMTRVSGTVLGAAGNGGAIQVTLTPIGSPVPIPGPRTTRLGPDGRFSFGEVTPGTYNVMAWSSQGVLRIAQDLSVAAGKAAADMAQMMALGKNPAGPDAPSQWASTEVVVDGRPLAPVSLALQAGLAVAGRIVFTGSTQPPTDFSRLRILTNAVTAMSPERNVTIPSALVDPSGRFTLTGLVPGRYRLNVAGAGGPWSIASALVAGHDAMDIPIDVRPSDDLGLVTITMTDRSTTLVGTLTDSSNRATADYTVAVFPVDPGLWLPQARRIQATRPSTDGHYSFRGLPPGDYRIAVVPDVEPGQWYDPAWLRAAMPAAIAITLADGQRLTQDLRVR